MADDGTIRDLTNGRVVGKTDNLAHAFAGAVTAGGPPCLIVGPESAIDAVRPYLPAWVEYVIEPDTPRGIVYAVEVTRAEWDAAGGADWSTTGG